jgi:anti-sigma regulatory factor (Ser/Thr protein kinase)
MPAEATRVSDPAADPALLPAWLMLGSMTLPGRPEHVRDARGFVARAVGDDPRADTALLLTSELVTNAIVHSRSRRAGGTVAVVVAKNAAGLLVTVTDNGSESGVPVAAGQAGDEHGNGLVLVETLADSWGCLRSDSRTTVWFRLGAGQPEDDYAAGLLRDHDPPAGRLIHLGSRLSRNACMPSRASGS